MPRQTLVIRADSSVASGTGHVIRCLALAQAWQDHGGDVIFMMAQSTPAIEQSLSDEGMGLVHLSETPGSHEDAKQLAQIARKNDADWIVVDGYQFDENYQFAIKQADLKLVFVDDTGKCGHYFADVVLNQNVTAREGMYPRREANTRLLLGADYVMLRREFERWHEWQRSFPIVAERILVTMGGSDPDALTLPLIRAFAKIRDFRVRLTVIAGGSNPRIAELHRATNEMGPQIQLLTDVRDMATVMANSDLAVICGGGTLWEALYMGCATLTYSRPGVQEKIIGNLSAAGAVLDLGPVDEFDELSLLAAVKDIVRSVQRRQLMAQRGREAVDGQGTSRVLQALTGSMPAMKVPVKMEPVVAADRGEFLQMALKHFRELNPAFRPDADWQGSYFENIQKREGCSLRWIVNDNERVGFILFGVEAHRFLPRKTGAIWELYIVPEKRRMGLAKSCAQSVIAELWKMSPSKIQLEVVDGNERAVALWESLGFQKAAARFVLARNRG
jgi:UDP-2,4-diacetamido-2,4,6-trideoxy-beta-L-altropyranose hydrolase